MSSEEIIFAVQVLNVFVQKSCVYGENSTFVCKIIMIDVFSISEKPFLQN